MSIYIFIYLISLSFLVQGEKVDTSQATPYWPKRFNTTFLEYPGKEIIVGNLYIDYEKGVQKIQRSNGLYHQLCAQNMPNLSTSCHQLVKDGFKYLIYPEKDSCCKCCNIQNDQCFYFPQKWLQKAQKTGIRSEGWDVYWTFQTQLKKEKFTYWGTFVQESKPRKIINEELQIYMTLNTNIDEEQVDSSVFNLPSKCEHLCPGKTCQNANPIKIDINPFWPQYFTQHFYEFTGQEVVNGQFSVDYRYNDMKIQRESSKFQPQCSRLQPNSSTPCTELIKNGTKYIVFPEKRFCCELCNVQEQDCFYFPENWLQNATYTGIKSESWEFYYSWSTTLKGKPYSFWGTMTENSTAYKIDNNDYSSDRRLPMRFSSQTLNTSQIPRSVFTLPDYCTRKCPQKIKIFKQKKSFNVQ